MPHSLIAPQGGCHTHEIWRIVEACAIPKPALGPSGQPATSAVAQLDVHARILFKTRFALERIRVERSTDATRVEAITTNKKLLVTKGIANIVTSASLLVARIY